MFGGKWGHDLMARAVAPCRSEPTFRTASTSETSVYFNQTRRTRSWPSSPGASYALQVRHRTSCPQIDSGFFRFCLPPPPTDTPTYFAQKIRPVAPHMTAVAPPPNSQSLSLQFPSVLPLLCFNSAHPLNSIFTPRKTNRFLATLG
jgi:hypothetical protein